MKPCCRGRRAGEPWGSPAPIAAPDVDECEPMISQRRAVAIPSFIAAMLGLLALAACDVPFGHQLPPNLAARKTHPNPPVVPPVSSGPQPRISEPMSSMTANLIPLPKLKPSRVGPAGPARGEPIDIIGLSQAETAGLLGMPKAERDMAPARVWRYETADCALDVFFYLDVSHNEFLALQYSEPGKSAFEATGWDCLQEIRSKLIR